MEPPSRRASVSGMLDDLALGKDEAVDDASDGFSLSGEVVGGSHELNGVDIVLRLDEADVMDELAAIVALPEQDLLAA